MVPVTVHTEGVVEANCTVRPELAVADRAGGVAPMVWLLRAAKLMVWVPTTKKLRGCVVAAA